MSAIRAGAWRPSLRAQQVDFVVAHTVDRIGYMSELLSDITLKPQECLVFGAFGHSYAIMTRTELPLPDVSHTVHRTPLRVIRASDHSRGSSKQRRFEGSAVPAPSQTLYSSSRLLDAVISVPGSQPRPTAEDASMLTDALRVATRATDGSAWLSLESPTHVPPDALSEAVAEHRRGQPSSRMALRFVVTIPNGQAADRLRIIRGIAAGLHEKAAAARAPGWSYGFWVNDPRPGRRSGEFVQVTQESPGEPPGDPDAARPVEWGYPISFVGPSRDGSLRAVLDLFGTSSRFRVLACAAGVRDHLDFVNLFLAVPEDVDLDSLDGIEEEMKATVASQGVDGAGLRPTSTIPMVLERLRIPWQISEPCRPATQEPSGDVPELQTLLGPPIRVTPLATVDRSTLWLRWTTVAHNLDLVTTFLLLAQALGSVVSTADPSRRNRVLDLRRGEAGSAAVPEDAEGQAPGMPPPKPDRVSRDGGHASTAAEGDGPTGAADDADPEQPFGTAVRGLTQLLRHVRSAATSRYEDLLVSDPPKADDLAVQLRTAWTELLQRLSVNVERVSTVQEDGLVYGYARLSVPSDEVRDLMRKHDGDTMVSFSGHVAAEWRRAAHDAALPFLEIRVSATESALGHSRDIYI